MKHRLVKRLRAEIKTLKARIRELEKADASYPAENGFWGNKSLDIDELQKQLRRRKYGKIIF